jgi:hypothetical protein
MLSWPVSTLGSFPDAIQNVFPCRNLVRRSPAQALTLPKARACHNGLAGVKCFKGQSNFSVRRLLRHDRARRECGQSHLDRRDVLHSTPASGQFPRARHGVLSGTGCIVAGPGREAALAPGRIWVAQDGGRAGRGQRRPGAGYGQAGRGAAQDGGQRRTWAGYGQAQDVGQRRTWAGYGQAQDGGTPGRGLEIA